MKKSFVLLSCFVTANAFAANVDYWYDVNNACPVRWCRSQPSTGECCAPTNAATTLPTATRSGYTLRGWTTSSVLDADETAGSLTNLVATKDASLSDISVNGATTLRTAWAKNCASNITGGACDLRIDDNGSVTYIPTPNNGYTCDSGCNTSNPVFEPIQSTHVPSWRVIQLADGDADTLSSPRYLCCDANGVKSGWYGGNTSSACTSMLSSVIQLTKPTKSGYNYNGHELDDGIVVVDSNGVINTSVSCASLSSNQTATAQFSSTASEPETVTINYSFDCGDGTYDCGSVPDSNKNSCTVGSRFNIDSPESVSDYEFVGFRINDRLYEPPEGMPVDNGWNTWYQCSTGVINVVFVMQPTTSVTGDWHQVTLYNSPLYPIPEEEGDL